MKEVPDLGCWERDWILENLPRETIRLRYNDEFESWEAAKFFGQYLITNGLFKNRDEAIRFVEAWSEIKPEVHIDEE